MSAKWGEIWKKPGRCLMVGFTWKMIADFNNRRDILQWINLIKVVCEKFKVCLKCNKWEKKAFRASFNLIDPLCS